MVCLARQRFIARLRLYSVIRRLIVGYEARRKGQDRTGQDRTGQDRTGQDRTGQDRTGQDRTGQDRTGQDNTIQDRTNLSYMKVASH